MGLQEERTHNNGKATGSPHTCYPTHTTHKHTHALQHTPHLHTTYPTPPTHAYTYYSHTRQNNTHARLHTITHPHKRTCPHAHARTNTPPPPPLITNTHRRRHTNAIQHGKTQKHHQQERKPVSPWGRSDRQSTRGGTHEVKELVVLRVANHRLKPVTEVLFFVGCSIVVFVAKLVRAKTFPYKTEYFQELQGRGGGSVKGIVLHSTPAIPPPPPYVLISSE